MVDGGVISSRNRERALGQGITVRRALPNRIRRMVGPWCFLDHFGTIDVAAGHPLQVGPHPHIGVQTVTWLFEGEVLHRDSLGVEQMISPGELNLMTAGRGIAHSERSPERSRLPLRGVQLWLALPETARHGDPDFTHQAALPVFDTDGLTVTVLVGELGGVVSEAAVHSPAVGLQVVVPAMTRGDLPLESSFAYGILCDRGGSSYDNGPDILPNRFYYLPPGHDRMTFECQEPSRFIVIGGPPWEKEIVMWWNFVARRWDEIHQARDDWISGKRFGEIPGEAPGDRMDAPVLKRSRLATGH
jgi:redox-sensitive bicupin YhaK (pirin superfamily)